VVGFVVSILSSWLVMLFSLVWIVWWVVLSLFIVDDSVISRFGFDIGVRVSDFCILWCRCELFMRCFSFVSWVILRFEWVCMRCCSYERCCILVVRCCCLVCRWL